MAEKTEDIELVEYTEEQRQELIEAIKNIGFRAWPTVATMDMGLQYDYVTADGFGTGFGGMGDWPVHYIRALKPEKWMQIRQKLTERTLELNDLAGTDLMGFVQNERWFPRMDHPELNDMLMGLLELPEKLPGAIYCYCDLGQWDVDARFYAEEKACLNAFEEDYCRDAYEPVEDMDFDRLQELYTQLSEEHSCFLYVIYDDENDQAV